MRGIRTFGVLAAVSAALVTGVTVPATAGALSTGIKVGNLTLQPCDLEVANTWEHPYCGSLTVPLDYFDASEATIKVGFAYLPSPDRSQRNWVAQEGGPGFPATDSSIDYTAMFGDSLRDHNLLLVDARGTGTTELIDCKPLQDQPDLPAGPQLTAETNKCAYELNHRFTKADGSWVHASDLFSTANDARDMARVIGALALGKVDLYGDSYGTYFSQAFMARYPQLLNSVLLDSAYEANDLDPWYRTALTTGEYAFNAACTRAVSCPPGSWQRFTELVARVRARPISGSVVGTDSALHHVQVDVTALANIVNDAGSDYEPYRQLDAATRAYLDHGDATPLLRLYAQDLGFDHGYFAAAPTDAGYFSKGAYVAVSCTDYPQLFDMRSTPAQRRVQLAASIKALPAATFAPFTTKEWISIFPITEPYTLCLDWPSPTHRADPPVPAGAAYPQNIPIVILSGDLDSLTPAAGGAHIAAQIGPNAHQYIAANTVHLVAEDNPHPDCGPVIVAAFMSDPNAHLDTSCLAKIPPVRVVPDYPARLAEARPATGPATLAVRQLAAVAVGAAGDATYRFNAIDGSTDLGLRGGAVTYDDDGNATLAAVRFTADTVVSGTVTATDDGWLAVVTIAGCGQRASFTVTWGDGRLASVRFGAVTLTAPAP